MLEQMEKGKTSDPSSFKTVTFAGGTEQERGLKVTVSHSRSCCQSDLPPTIPSMAILSLIAPWFLTKEETQDADPGIFRLAGC